MDVVVIEPPAQIVSLELAKQHLRLDTDDDDTLVSLYITAAQAMIDGPGGWLGRAIGPQTLELRLSGFPTPIWGWGFDRGGLFWGSNPGDSGRPCGSGGRITLPYPPLISVTSVIYKDATGADQTLPSSAYLASEEGIGASYGTTFPSGRIEADAVRIQYSAGYETVPPIIIAALLLMVGDLYSNRQTVETGVRAAAIAVPMSTTVEALLGPYRVW